MSAEAKKAFRKQRKAFIKKFGREPGPGDPVFFDPDAPGTVPKQIDEGAMRAEIIAAMGKAGIAPHIVYAFAKTGLILTEDRRSNYEPEAIAEYDAAIDEYFELEAKKSGG